MASTTSVWNVAMESEICIIKETPDSELCGGEVYTYLTTLYMFDSGERFEFRLGVCRGHQEVLVERYTTEFGDVSVSAT